jgi:DNA-binding Xre family transcriptional regulator
MTGAKLKIDPSKLRKHYLPPTKPCRATWSKEAQYEAKVVEHGRPKRSIKTSRPAPQPHVVRKKEKAIRDAGAGARSTVRLDIDRVTDIMADRGISVVKLAAAYGVAESRMYYILDSYWITPKCLKRLAKALNVRQSEIVLYRGKKASQRPKPVEGTYKRKKRTAIYLRMDVIRKLMEERGWKSGDLADAIGTTRPTIYSAFCRQRVSLNRVYQIAEALDVFPGEIMRKEEPK